MPNGRIVVTGASRGIGAAIARALATDGWRIAGLSRQGVSAAGDGYACDMTDEGAIQTTIARIAADGPIDGLVNNAGRHSAGPSADLTAKAFESVLRSNATSMLIAAREVRPHLVAAGGGLIVNIGSFFDKLGVPENTAYCASKAAVGAISRCLAVEWARDRIRVLCVAPGYVATDLNRDFLASDAVRAWIRRRIPTGGPASADDVARFVAGLFAADVACLTGETIYLDGGHGINH